MYVESLYLSAISQRQPVGRQISVQTLLIGKKAVEENVFLDLRRPCVK